MPGEYEQGFVYSLAITLILGVLNFFGYFFIVGFLGMTEVPIVVRQIDDYIAEMKDNPTGVQTRNPHAFTW